MPNSFSHEQLRDIFSEALELGAGERAAFLDKKCGGNSELRVEVESLLAAFEKSEDFIENPAARFDAVVPARSNLERIVGNYRIIREIGRGGMGAVYLAKRDDGEFEKNVAVKLSRQTIADGELVRHFLAERQILAKLQHPNIATLLDGGVTDDGQPFLAMEFIDGVAITDFCKANELSTRDRLKLFLRVCRAVAYAHRNLIVHRDIKPSNILVNSDGEPKLLDFGLARLTDENTDQEQTKTIFRALTPAYASPEQLLGQTITTASDIYSLGVVLYEILTGTRPFATENKSLDDVIRTVVNSEPPPPSTIASEYVGRNHRLSGDIDNVILMALRKEPERRYSSAEDFARDVENCLDGLPVIARPNTFSYRTVKFVRRNRISVVASLLIVAALVVGIVVSLRQTRLALASRAEAEREAVKSRKITAFMEKILNYANPAWYAEGRQTNGEAKLTDILDELAGRIETEFPDDLDVQAEIHHKYAEIYLSKRKTERGMYHAQRALELRRRVFGEENAEVAKDLYYLSASNQASGNIRMSTQLGEEAVRVFYKVDPENANLPYLLENLGDSKRHDYGDSVAAQSYLEESLRLFRKRDGENHFNTIRQTLSLGVTLAVRGQMNEAEDVFRDGETRLLNLPDENLRNNIVEYRFRFESAKGNIAVAQKIIEDRLPLIESDRAASSTYRTLAGLLEGSYEATKSYEKKCALLRLAVARETTESGPHTLAVGVIRVKLAVSLLRIGRKNEGEAELAAALRIFRSADNPDIFYKKSLGQAMYLSGRYRDAETFLAPAVEFYAVNVPPNDESKELDDMLDKARAALKE